MIFVAVGTQFPFDRLIRTVDGWAAAGRRTDVYAQVGPATFQPSSIHAEQYLSPSDFADRCQQASLLVAHAGMGLIISALRMGKPIIIMPRRASLGEHRNEHQLATAARFSGRPGVYVATDPDELIALLDRSEELTAGPEISDAASPSLLAALGEFIDQERVR